jgi:hypothetical protein
MLCFSGRHGGILPYRRCQREWVLKWRHVHTDCLSGSLRRELREIRQATIIVHCNETCMFAIDFCCDFCAYRLKTAAYAVKTVIKRAKDNSRLILVLRPEQCSYERETIK